MDIDVHTDRWRDLPVTSTLQDELQNHKASLPLTESRQWILESIFGLQWEIVSVRTIRSFQQSSVWQCVDWRRNVSSALSAASISLYCRNTQIQKMQAKIIAWWQSECLTRRKIQSLGTWKFKSEHWLHFSGEEYVYVLTHSCGSNS